MVQCYFVLDRCVTERKGVQLTRRPLDEASLRRSVPVTRRPLDKATLGQGVPWTRRLLEEASLGRDVPWYNKYADVVQAQVGSYALSPLFCTG